MTDLVPWVTCSVAVEAETVLGAMYYMSHCSGRQHAASMPGTVMLGLLLPPWCSVPVFFHFGMLLDHACCVVLFDCVIHCAVLHSACTLMQLTSCDSAVQDAFCMRRCTDIDSQQLGILCFFAVLLYSGCQHVQIRA